MVQPYLPITETDRKKMLQTIGAESIEELFKGIPEKFFLNKPPDVPGPMSEFEIRDWAGKMLGCYAPALRSKTFLGGGVYDHFSPSIVNHLTLRAEFLTSYTPYQPEVSQGNLQALFEFQSMIASLMGMDISNASHYDGATSLADAVIMALRTKPKAKRVLTPSSLNPDYQAILKTYLPKEGVELEILPEDEKSGSIDIAKLEELLAKGENGSSVVIVQSPNYLGIVEPLKKISDTVHAKEGQFLTVVTEPISMGILQSPGEAGADIAVGEGQAFGLPPSFGGPLLGLLACKKDYLRQVPGRLCGKTVDEDGRDSYVLTLSTREQHIRRARATSNICTNQNLCALSITIYLSLLGKKGLKEIAIQNLSLTEYLKGKIKSIKGADIPLTGKTFNEFVVRFSKPAKEICEEARKRQEMILGLPLDECGRPNDLLVTVTETKRKTDLDKWIECVQSIL